MGTRGHPSAVGVAVGVGMWVGAAGLRTGQWEWGAGSGARVLSLQRDTG